MTLTIRNKTCPACGKRFADRTTGWQFCGRCHRAWPADPAAD